VQTREKLLAGRLVNIDQTGFLSQSVHDAYFERFEVITDVTNGNKKDFHPLEWTKTRTTLMNGFSSSSSVINNDFTRSTGWFGFSPIRLVPNGREDAYDKCYSRFVENLRGSLDLSVDFAEAHQVSSMMKKSLLALGNLAKTVRAMRHLNTKAAANAWLEFTYGWKPLASSIWDTFTTHMTMPPIKVVATASVREEYSESTTSGLYNGSFQTIRTGKGFGSNRCKIEGWFQPPQSERDRLNRYTSLNPFSIAWELVPYSFIIDWFVDIGGYMRNLETAWEYRSRFIKGYVTESYLSEITTEDRFQGTVGLAYKQVAANGWDSVRGSKRSTYSFFPTPAQPRFKIDLGASRLISAASLLRQKLR